MKSLRDMPEHQAWRSMRSRCRPGTVSAKNYADRGIAVCERWHLFENFYADMGPRPTPDHSLDRVDVDGDYEPGNVRWATPDVQNRNKRSTVIDCTKAAVVLQLIDIGVSRAAIAASFAVPRQYIDRIATGRTKLRPVGEQLLKEVGR